MKRPLTIVLVAAALAVPGMALLGRPDPAKDTGQATAAPASGSSVVATYGVGGVLKSDGNLYQWRPERRQWVSIDESFRIDGEKRNVLPLPVAASEVARMEGFGFIVTRGGTAYLYNLDSNRWENIGRP